MELVQQTHHHLMCLQSEDSVSNTSTPGESPAGMSSSQELMTLSDIPQTTLWSQPVVRWGDYGHQMNTKILCINICCHKWVRLKSPSVWVWHLCTMCVSWQHTEDIAGHGSHSKLITLHLFTVSILEASWHTHTQWSLCLINTRQNSFCNLWTCWRGHGLWGGHSWSILWETSSLQSIIIPIPSLTTSTLACMGVWSCRHNWTLRITQGGSHLVTPLLCV